MPRHVTRLFRGHDNNMWRVKSHNSDTMFEVNSQHILTLKSTRDIIQITDSKEHEGVYIVSWLEKYRYTPDRPMKYIGCKELFTSLEIAARYAESLRLLENGEVLLPDEVIDLSVMDYLLLRESNIDLITDGLHLFHPAIDIEWSSVATDTAIITSNKTATDLDDMASYHQLRLASVQERRIFLDGLISLNNDNGISLPERLSQPIFVMVSKDNEQAAHDIAHIARSIGYTANVSMGAHDVGGVSISENETSSFAINRVAGADFFGFELTDNGRYLLGDFTVTHNSNGKSKCVELYDKALGDYTCKFPVTLLTQKRAASNSATSEIARAKGRRFACLQEPSEDERLNIGLLKELTGGDKVQARAIYKEPVEFKPQWHIALLCNHLPNVPSDDGGTWRRIRVVNFTSKFVERPIAENEFPMNTELAQKLDDWKEPFMSMLVEYYKTRYANKKLIEPDDVTECTREYQKQNDHYADFIDSCIEKAPADSTKVYLSSMDAFNEFKAWLKQDNIPVKSPKRKDLQKYLDRALGKPVQRSGDSCWEGYMLRDRFNAYNDEDDTQLLPFIGEGKVLGYV